MKFYLIGIKGAGMCALANILFDLGYEVKGCDYSKDFFTSTKLKRFQIENILTYKVDNNYIYIIGNAYKNIDKKNIKNYYDYPEFIESFFRMSKISISGTHGKTTTTSFISQIVDKKLNVLCGDGTGIGNKDAKHLVLEACEYKNHFLNYTNELLLINNIEFDHPDFFNNINEVILSFQKAADNSQVVILNGDCLNCLKINHHNIIRFGMKEYNDIKFLYKIFNDCVVLTVYFYGNKEEIILPILGEHNIYNYVASYIISKLIDVSDSFLIEKSKKLLLPSRRMQMKKVDNSIIVDDYAHHPTEIKCTLSYFKNNYKDYKIVTFFQPHTYSRTNALLDNFIESLSISDEVYILDVFSSVREKGEGNILLEKSFFKKFDEKYLVNIGENKIVYIFMGAGDINKYIK